MAYSDDIKERAFGFYCTGISFEAIAEALQKQFPEKCASMTRQTLATWERRYHWAARKDKIQRRVREKLDAERVSRRQELLTDLDEMFELLVSAAPKLKAKSLEGTANSAIALGKFILQLRGELGGKAAGVDVEQVITIIFEVLSEDAAIARRLEERQQFFLQQIQERMERAA